MRTRAIVTSLALTALASLTACEVLFGGKIVPDDSGNDAAVPDASGMDAVSDGTTMGDAPSNDGALVDAGPVVVLAQGLTQPAEVVVDDTYAYWVEYSVNGGVYRVRKDGSSNGVVETVATDQAYPVDLVVDDAQVYWVTQGGNGSGTVMRADKTGTNLNVKTIGANLAFPNRVAIDRTNVYWTLEVAAPNGAVMWAPKDASKSPQVLVSNLNNPGGIAAARDGTALFVTVEGSVEMFGSTDGEVLRIPLGVPCLSDGGCAQTLAGSLARPFVARVDDSFVYWGQRWRYGDALNHVQRLAMSGGDAAVLYTSAMRTERAGISVDDAGLAWTERADGGGIYLGAKDGGQSTLLLGGVATPQGVAMDSAYVYVTVFGGGVILRIARQ